MITRDHSALVHSLLLAQNEIQFVRGRRGLSTRTRLAKAECEFGCCTSLNQISIDSREQAQQQAANYAAVTGLEAQTMNRLYQTRLQRGAGQGLVEYAGTSDLVAVLRIAGLVLFLGQLFPARSAIWANQSKNNAGSARKDP